MDVDSSILSILLSRRLDPTAISAGQIFRLYVLRQINLIQWLSLIAITLLLLKHLARVFDLRRKQNPIPPLLPFQSLYSHLMLLARPNPQHNLTGKTSTGQF